MAEQFRNLLSLINLPVFYMPSIGFNSILDIFFITFVVYKILIWIKETRAWALFKGIGVVVLIYVFAFIFRLDTTIWIIESSLSVAVIAALIIFQPELRKALERLGNNRNLPILSGLVENKNALNKHFIQEIAQACKQLSETKTGALIAIEQQVPMGDIEATGVAIDALISRQLLVNIFENKTPLHDGAVLIRGDRVRAATCILPLTSEKLSSNLGTRHRAAKGASEVSDAYIVVVSEETGSISVAKNGKLHRNLTYERLIAFLSENIRPETKKKTGLLGWLIKSR